MDEERVSDNSTTFQELGEVRSFKEGSEEEVPLEVWEGEELGRRRHGGFEGTQSIL